MQAVPFNTTAFQGDQRTSFTVRVWDTPFLVMEGAPDDARAATNGIIMDMREPYEGAAWSLHTSLAGKTPSQALSAWTAHASRTVVSQGRIGTLMDYWAGGAPGWHGATQRGRVAYHFRAYLRPAGNRAWFSQQTAITMTFMVGGSGYFRIDHNGTTTLLDSIYTEKDYLASAKPGLAGLATSVVATVNAGDYLDFYYVQRDEDPWGGYVFKAYAGDLLSLDNAAREDAKRDAPVVTAGLMDDNTPVVPHVLQYVRNPEVIRELEQAGTASFEAVLLNPAANDGCGWEWRRDTTKNDDPGALRYHEGNIALKQWDMKRERLVQITMAVSPNESWTVFTGSIKDFEGISGGSVRVSCVDPAGRLLQRYDKNYPDRIDYMARNYRKRLGATQPAYDTPALDNWPLEYAFALIALRGGLDEAHLRQPLTVPLSTGKVARVTYGGTTFRKMRARSMDPKGKQIRLERAPHYGNPGRANQAKPADDPYVFPPEPTRELWNRIRALSDRYGYDAQFDEFGHFVVRATNNPCYVYNFELADATGGTMGTHPNAYGGQYLAAPNGTVVTKVVQGARIDVAFGRSPTTGTWTYSVVRDSDSVVVASGSVNTTSTREEYFYDYRAATDGVNSTVARLYSGDFDLYTVTLTSSGANVADMVLVYHTDPERSLLPRALSTASNALSVEVTDALAEMRNFVIVVGRRRTSTTDSEKLQTTEQNPEPEFVVAAAVDAASIVDPTALHYVGQIRETIIYSDGITDDDFAQYLARVFIYRYRNPRAGATIEHTGVPFVQLRDAVLVAETKFNTMDTGHTRFVKRVQHTMDERGRFVSRLDVEAWLPYPAYEPRNDIDIDATFQGRPAINVEVSYTSLDGTALTNVTADAVHISKDQPTTAADPGDIVTVTGVAPSSGALSLAGQPWPPVPGTVFIRPTAFNSSVARDKVTWTETDLKIVKEKMVAGSVLEIPKAMTSLVDPDNITLQIKVYTYGGYPKGYLERISENNITKAPGKSVGTVVRPIGWYYELKTEGGVTRLYLKRALGGNDPLKDNYYQAQDEDLYVTITKLEWYQAKTQTDWLTNTPYHHYFTTDYANQKLTLDWQQADPTITEYQLAGVTGFDVKYRRVRPATDPYATSGSPFYDPYTSELGYLVKVSADFLVSGLYRVSVRSIHKPDVVVAWLTEPSNDSTDPDNHFTFFGAGTARTFYWDGSDTQGAWNFEQSADYADMAMGAFEQNQRPRIGKGFYVWNREVAGGSVAPRALIDGTLASSQPTWGAGCQGTFAGWFVVIEATNDDLEEATDLAQEKTPVVPPLPRIAATYRIDGTTYQGLVDTFQTNSTGSKAEAVVWTHLPAPARVRLEVADWKPALDFDETNTTQINTTSNWLTGDASYVDNDYGYINNFKPLRLRFVAEDRPGVLWAGVQDEQSFKIIPHVHLKFLLHDQFTLFDGVAYAGSNVEQRQIVSRRLHNDTHTLVFPDTTYRKAKTLKSDTNLDGYEFIFQPKRFVKNWTGAREEPLQFGNSLQLEEVPKWDGARTVAGARSRSNINFVAYLWYVSAYTQDRSGRYAWGLNTNFLDASKLVRNRPVGQPFASTQYRAAWPDDPMRQHRRTVVARQWMKERVDRLMLWTDYQKQRWGLTSGIGAKLVEHKWRDHDPSSATINSTNWSDGALGLVRDQYSTNDLDRLDNIGFTSDVVFVRQLPGVMGAWSFEATPLWQPCITRDFYPYQLIPPQMDHYCVLNHTEGRSTIRAIDARDGAIFVSVDNAEPGKYKEDKNGNVTDNSRNDPAVGDVWSSAMWDMSVGNDSQRTKYFPGSKVARDAYPINHRDISNNNIEPACFDYTRQDDQVHWEELRGVWSRGPRPGEQARRVTPSLPYYINHNRLAGLYTFHAVGKQTAYPNYVTVPMNQFGVHFRGEYVWESASLFPTNIFGVEFLQAYNYEHARVFERGQLGNVRYDSGAWVGWKDDLDGTGPGDAPSRTFVWDVDLGTLPTQFPAKPKGVFESGFMPIAVSRSVPSDRDVYFHLSLLNERRDVPADVNDVTTGVGTPTSVQFTPSSINTDIGLPTSVTVMGLDASAKRVDGMSFTFSVADPSICDVTFVDRGEAMTVLPKKVGTTTITATGKAGLATVTGTLSVTVGSTTGAVSISGTTAVVVWQTAAITATSTSGKSIVWSCDEPNAVNFAQSTTASGAVNYLTPTREGSFTITTYSDGRQTTFTLLVIALPA